MITALLLLASAHANERSFTYTYDALPLPTDLREYEVSTTFSPGSASGFDVGWRGEIEFPVSHRVLSAVYLNLASGDHPFDGVSYEVKGTLLSPITAPIGVALYGELSLRPDEVELEAKLILDKRVRDGMILYNGAAERAWVKDVGGISHDLTVENDLAIGYRIMESQLSFGAEASAPYTVAGADSTGAVFVGPAIGVAPEERGWWGTVSVLPRAVTFGPGLGDAQPWQVRAIFSLEL